MTPDPVFEVQNLKKHYTLTKGYLNSEVGVAKAVDGISFAVEEGETFGIVGESGCGKSTAATTMLRLEEPTEGRIFLDGEDMTAYSEDEMRQARREMQMVFQEPESSFDPRMSVLESVSEPLRVQGLTDRETRRSIVGDLLERVGLSRDDMDKYPHEFSGGQKQRIALARALSVNPSLLVADEPVSALDVSIQSEILKLINQFQAETGLAVIVISHNLGVVQEVCDRVAVMYLGEFVEVAPTEELFTNPQHPYTQALLDAIPKPDPSGREATGGLRGDVPDPAAPPSGCRFHPRCPQIIPPDEVTVQQEVWRNVLHLTDKIEQDDVDVDAISKLYSGESGPLGGSSETATDGGASATEMAGYIRDHYDIPKQIGDPDVERTVREAIDHLTAGEQEQAAALVSDEFTTVCEREKPSLEQVGANHTAACHLNDETARDR